MILVDWRSTSLPGLVQLAGAGRPGLRDRQRIWLAARISSKTVATTISKVCQGPGKLFAAQL